MCGIWGALTKGSSFSSTEVDKILPQLLMAGNLRGIDGAGMFSIHKDLTTKVSRKSGNSFHLYFDKQFEEHKKSIWANGIGYFGHNRAATKGEIKDKNTHPFETDHLVLIHNGTVTAGLSDYKNHHDVDSAGLAHAIEDMGMLEVSKKVSMAYALIWFDKRDQTLHFCRNYERPLHILETSTAFFFVSEPLMMQWILERNNEKITRVVTVDTLKEYVINLKTDEMATIELKTPTSYNYNNNYHGYPTNPPIKETAQEQINKQILFKITGSAKQIPNQKKRPPAFIHRGKTTKGFDIVFTSTKEVKPANPDDLYEGIPSAIEKTGQLEALIIKVKTIKKWPNASPKEDIGEDLTDNDILDLGDSNFIEKSDFEKEAKWGCGCCKGRLYLVDSHKYALMPDGKGLLCDKCTIEMFSSPKDFKEKLLESKYVN